MIVLLYIQYNNQLPSQKFLNNILYFREEKGSEQDIVFLINDFFFILYFFPYIIFCFGFISIFYKLQYINYST